MTWIVRGVLTHDVKETLNELLKKEKDDKSSSEYNI